MPIKNIVASVANAATSLVTAKYAIYLAKTLGAKLTVVFVVNKGVMQELLRSRVFVEVEAAEYEHDLEEQGKQFLERIKKLAEAKAVEFEGSLLKGVVHDEVTNKIKDLNAELLVMGEVKEILSIKDSIYDEGKRIFHDATCPVLIVKNPQEVERLYKEI